jgi:large subunit ribosomal protein L31
MRKNIHPKYHEVEVLISEDVFHTNSTFHGDKILMDVDYRKHPAWCKGSRAVVDSSNKNISDFNKKYGSFGNLFSQKNS